jgi:hypothetical protein
MAPHEGDSKQDSDLREDSVECPVEPSAVDSYYLSSGEESRSVADYILYIQHTVSINS